MTVKDYLIKKEIVFEEKTRPSGLQYIFNCPFCGEQDKSFAINAETGAYQCYHKNKCGKTGSFYNFQSELGDTPVFHKPVINNIKTNKIYKIPKIPKIKLSDKWIKYLTEERKLTLDTIQQFNLFCGIRGELCMPYYKDNKIVNALHRTIDKKIWQEKQCEPTLYNINCIKNKELLIITEGQFDCMSLVQYGMNNITSLPNGVSDLKWIENEWEFLKDFKEIFLVMDMDIAGQQAVKVIIERLGKWRCKSVQLPYKDINECLKNKLTNEELLSYFENAVEFKPNEIKNAGNFCEEVIDIINNPEKFKGEETGLPGLTSIIRGWRKGEVTIWTGQNHSGKTTILNQICLFLANRKTKTCVASLELRAARYLKWAICQALGEETPPENRIIEAFTWLNEWMFVLNIDDNVPASKIFELFEYVARRYGVEHFIIDSLMRVKLKGDDENRSQGEFVSDYTAFAKRFNVHCHLVAHPRKQQTDEDVPGKVDVKGSGDITNLADNVIVVYRNSENKKDEEEGYDTFLYIRKNREFGEIGKVGLVFDPVSKRSLCLGQPSIFY